MKSGEDADEEAYRLERHFARHAGDGIVAEAEERVNFAPHGQCGTVKAQPSAIYTSVIKEHLTAHNILKTGRSASISPPPRCLTG